MLKLFKLPDKLFKYLTVAVLLVIPLYPKFPFLRIPGIQVSVRLEDFLMAVVAFCVAIAFIPKLKKLFQRSIERAQLLYILVGLAALLSAVFITKTAVGYIGILHLVRRIEYFIPFLLALLALKSKDENLAYFIKILLLVTLIAFVYGFGQKYFNWPVIVTQNVEYAKGIALRWAPGSHINSTFAGHYDLATFLVLVLPIFISYFYCLANRMSKVVVGLTILAGLWLLMASVSRISIFSYLVGSSAALVILKKYKEIFVVAIISLVIFGFSADVRARYFRVIEVLQDKVADSSLSVYAYAQEPNPTKSLPKISTPTPTPVLEDRSSSIRFNVEWPRAIRALAKNPLLGTGFSSITLATDNDYLRALGETGLLGFFALMLILARIGRLFLKNISLIGYQGVQKPFLAGVMGGTGGVLVNAVFIDVFEASKFAIVFWLIIGLAVACLRTRDE